MQSFTLVKGSLVNSSSPLFSFTDFFCLYTSPGNWRYIFSRRSFVEHLKLILLVDDLQKGVMVQTFLSSNSISILSTQEGLRLNKIFQRQSLHSEMKLGFRKLRSAAIYFEIESSGISYIKILSISFTSWVHMKGLQKCKVYLLFSFNRMYGSDIAQKNDVKDFFNKCDQIRSFL